MTESIDLEGCRAFAPESTPWAHLANDANVSMHWQVTDLDTKRRLWDGVFDYDLNLFSPGGPEDSPDTAFLAITAERVLVVKQYGIGGMRRWSSQ